MSDLKRASLLVVGIHLSSEAYPNTLYRVRDLREHFGADEIDEPLWTTPAGGWTSIKSPLRVLWRALVSHLRVVMSVVRKGKHDVAYVPYPAPSVVLLLSLLPQRFRPRRFVLDGFISIYDTIVNDRKIWSRRSVPAKALYALERRAFSRVDAVLVDTPQNADFYAEMFRLPRSRFVPLPLATNEVDFASKPYVPTAGRCRVLFVGTLVPLHGVGTIVEAAKLLSSRDDIEFRILGDGVDGETIQNEVKGLGNVVWQRRWHSSEELGQEIGRADICLGIFGDTDKAQRVCPYKLYAYASVGRATITGATDWLRSADHGHERAFLGVRVSNPSELADAIERLADDVSLRMSYARSVQAFYQDRLSNRHALGSLKERIGSLF